MTTTTTAPSLPVNPGTAAATAVDRAERPPITPRPGPREFDGVPKHWFAGQPVPTQISNGVNLLFPAGERFFVRSVYHYLDRIDDPKLKEAIKGFGGQEGRHARSHEDFFAAMRGHGYEIDRFLKVYEWLSYTLLERLAHPRCRPGPRRPAHLRRRLAWVGRHRAGHAAGQTTAVEPGDGRRARGRGGHRRGPRRHERNRCLRRI